LPGDPGRGIAVVDPQLAARTIAIGVDRCLRHAELARDLLGRQMLIDQPQALALTWREQGGRIGSDVCTRAHKASN